jgi:hypothetical protein
VRAKSGQQPNLDPVRKSMVNAVSILYIANSPKLLLTVKKEKKKKEKEKTRTTAKVISGRRRKQSQYK